MTTHSELLQAFARFIESARVSLINEATKDQWEEAFSDFELMVLGTSMLLYDANIIDFESYEIITNWAYTLRYVNCSETGIFGNCRKSSYSKLEKFAITDFKFELSKRNREE